MRGRARGGPLHANECFVSADVLVVGRPNPQLRWRPAYQEARIGRLKALTTAASHVSAMVQFERVLVAGAHLPDHSLLYAIGVAPEHDASTCQLAFARSLESIKILDRTKN